MNSPRQSLLGGLLISGLLSVGSAVYGQSIVFNDFSNTTGLQINGNATTTAGAVPSDGTVLRLTSAGFNQAGSAFSTTQITLNNSASFSTMFTFRITSSGGISDGDGVGADGIVFVVQPIANNVGSAGGGIGYLGIPQSLGIEFDTWDNGPGFADPNGNHVGIDINGGFSSANVAQIPTRMNNGALWTAWVDYNGATQNLEVRLANDGIRSLNPLLQTNSINLAGVLGQNSAYVGFTAGTGSAWGNQDIVSWRFNNDYHPITNAVPDSGTTLAMLGLGLGGLFAYARRRRA